MQYAESCDTATEPDLTIQSGLRDLVEKYLKLNPFSEDTYQRKISNAGETEWVKIIKWDMQQKNRDSIIIEYSDLKSAINLVENRIFETQVESIVKTELIHLLRQFLPNPTSSATINLDDFHSITLKGNNHFSYSCRSYNLFMSLLQNYIRTKKEWVKEEEKLKNMLLFLQNMYFIIKQPSIATNIMCNKTLSYAESCQKQLRLFNKTFSSFNQNFLFPSEIEKLEKYTKFIQNTIPSITQLLTSPRLDDFGYTIPDLNRATATTLCGHTYHAYCLYEWLLTNNDETCPTCRQQTPIDTKMIYSLFGDSHDLCVICQCALNKSAQETSHDAMAQELFGTAHDDGATTADA